MCDFADSKSDSRPFEFSAHVLSLGDDDDDDVLFGVKRPPTTAPSIASLASPRAEGAATPSAATTAAATPTTPAAAAVATPKPATAETPKPAPPAAAPAATSGKKQVSIIVCVQPAGVGM